MADLHIYPEFCRYGAIPETIYVFHRRDGRSGESCEQASGEIISILPNINLNLPTYIVIKLYRQMLPPPLEERWLAIHLYFST